MREIESIFQTENYFVSKIVKLQESTCYNERTDKAMQRYMNWVFEYQTIITQNHIMSHLFDNSSQSLTHNRATICQNCLNSQC